MTLFLIVGFLAAGAQTDERHPAALISNLEKADDDKLAEIFKREWKNKEDWRRRGLNACLSEMVRRGGDRWRELVSGALGKASELPESLTKEGSIEMRTALRRLQGKTDPVVIEVAPVGNAMNYFPFLPAVGVSLKNADPEGAAVAFTAGGDYRSGRPERWRIQVTDGSGKHMQVRTDFGFGMGGGIYSNQLLRPGETWSTSLPMRNFVQTLPAGEYTVVVQYSDSDTIAGEKDPRGRILCLSKPFRLKVERRGIQLTTAERDTFAREVGGLPDEGVVKILEGTYSPEAHEFIPPDSPAGRLLSGGWKAVPSLLDALKQPLPPVRRAWVFALLANLGGDGFPSILDGSAFGKYELRSAPWAVEMEGAAGFGESGSMTVNGAIQESAQTEKAAWWAEWAKSLDVRLKE